MLTIAECRALLGGDAPESDADVEALRDLLYLLSRSAIDAATEDEKRGRDGEDLA